jgi:DNA-binding CsgD family transcriptional regulator/PAS domain-containing protein
MTRPMPDVVAELLGSLYEAVDDDAAWPVALEALRVACNGSKVCFGIENEIDFSGSAIGVGGGDPSLHDLYARELAPHNVAWRAMVGAPAGAVSTDRAVMPKRDFRRTRLFNEFLAPQDDHSLMTCKVLAQGDVSGFVSIHRGGGQPDFESADIELMTWLAPILVRAAAFRQRIRSLEFGAGASLAVLDRLAFGTIVCEPPRRIVHLNAAAGELLRRHRRSLRQHGGHLAAGQPADTRRLECLIADACRVGAGGAGLGGHLRLEARDGGGPALALTVSPLPIAAGGRRAAIVAVREIAEADTADLERQATAFFGLTRAEARLAGALCGGRSLRAAAGEQAISISTARTHLVSIFRKTETAQQSQLVARLKSVCLPLSAGRDRAATDCD